HALPMKAGVQRDRQEQGVVILGVRDSEVLPEAVLVELHGAEADSKNEVEDRPYRCHRARRDHAPGIPIGREIRRRLGKGDSQVPQQSGTSPFRLIDILSWPNAATSA